MSALVAVKGCILSMEWVSLYVYIGEELACHLLKKCELGY